MTDVPVVFLDTSTAGMNECSGPDGALSNRGEADEVLKYVLELVSSGMEPSNIVIISPYKAQVTLIRGMLTEAGIDLEVGTVDGFQGRESEAVIISLVRSNELGDIGFLAESRRLNVAVTRARRHVCIVGDSRTLERGGGLRGLVKYLEDVGDVRVPNE